MLSGPIAEADDSEIPANRRGGFEIRPYNVTELIPVTLPALPVGFALFGEGAGAFLAVFGGE